MLVLGVVAVVALFGCCCHGHGLGYGEVRGVGGCNGHGEVLRAIVTGDTVMARATAGAW